MSVDVKTDLLASDSMGVRSMAVRLETKDVSVLIDPGASLGPLRFGLPPAREEENALERCVDVIRERAASSDCMVVSHYHYDHHLPEASLFANKKLFLKDPAKNINKSQRQRAKHLSSILSPAAEVHYADGSSWEDGKTTISFSPPVPHGPPGTRLGYVIMTAVSCGGDTVVHTGDIEGMLDEEGFRWITDLCPTLVIADGPPLYLVGYKFSRKNMSDSIAVLHRLVDALDCTLVVDHHLLRSKDYRQRTGGLFDDYRVTTFAGYHGLEERLLEANRKELHKKTATEGRCSN